MRTSSFVRCAIFALFLLSVSTAAFAQIGIYVSFGPPAIPVYDQPLCPGDGYIWVPGYWAWDGAEYYWVPGTWVLPPAVGFLWTPGYWEWGVNGFFFHEGYWGPHVGWYGGINYGFGYFGRGYEGGRWDGGHFFYNRAVNNINFNVIHNVYENRAFYNNPNRVSYNGGSGGITERPTSEELAFSRERHYAPTAAQTQHVAAARGNRDLRASVNVGKPPIAATQRPSGFSDHTVGAAETGGRWQPSANPARPAIHPNDLPPLERSNPPYTGNTKLDQKYQQQQDKLYAKMQQEHQQLQQKQEQEHQRMEQQHASEAQKQQMEQRHQQQTQQMEQRHQQQIQRLQQKQSPPRR